MKAIKDLARERMKGHCRVCPVCDGRVCSGEVPGMGGLGTGSSFRANLEALANVKLAMRCLHGAALPDTSTEVLGLKLTMPVMAAPIGGLDALYATVQMPSGFPVATVALNGAKNTAWLAAQIIALNDERVAALIRAEREGYKSAVETSAAELEQRYA